MNMVVVPARQATYTLTAWRNWNIGIDSWAPLKFKKSDSECSSGGGGGLVQRVCHSHINKTYATAPNIAVCIVPQLSAPSELQPATNQAMLNGGAS